MIKKMTALTAPVPLVQALFRDIDAWPQWMPGVRGVRVLERRPDYARVDLKTALMGHELQQTVEFQLREGRFTQRQLAGRFKKWDAEWCFLPAPTGDGTTLCVTLDFNLGVLGYLVSPRRLGDAINDWFNQLTKQVEEQTRRMQEKKSTIRIIRPIDSAEETLLEIFQTADGLEVRVGHLQFQLRAEP